MRSVVAIVVSVVLSSACAKKSPAPPPNQAVEAKPSMAKNGPFHWSLEVHDMRDRNGTARYHPGPRPQLIPTEGSDWQCAHGGLKADYTSEGDWLEARDVVCRLKSGHAVGGRTVCYREPSGRVAEDTQVLSVSDAEGHAQLKILVMCSENAPKGDPAAAPPPTPTHTDKPPATYYEPKKTYDL